MNTRQLRARLDRLTPPAKIIPGQDRDRDRRRRRELDSRDIGQCLTDLEKAEKAEFDAFYYDEDRDRSRMIVLSLKQFCSKRLGREPLTDIQTKDLSELELRFPPDPNDPMKKTHEAFHEAVKRYKAEDEKNSSRRSQLNRNR